MKIYTILHSRDSFVSIVYTEKEIENYLENTESSNTDGTFFDKLKIFHARQCEIEGCQSHEFKIFLTKEEFCEEINQYKNYTNLLEKNLNSH